MFEYCLMWTVYQNQFVYEMVEGKLKNLNVVEKNILLRYLNICLAKLSNLPQRFWHKTYMT